MPSTHDDHPEPTRAGGCLDLETLDRIVSDPGYRPGAAVAHLESCERCRDRLAEMRKADLFLERFRSSVVGGAGEGLGDMQTPLIAGYASVALIAYGGQGVVYRARQQGTDREVAIKVPLASAMRRASARYRFEREIELTARLDHPGIVRVLGSCELGDGRLGCVMEFVPGEGFDTWASARRERGELRAIVEAVCQIADAIAYAHRRAVIHRDIKPSNVIVTDEGQPRVLDFGLAKAIDEHDSSFATLTGAFLGTLMYSAPEQISAGASATDLRTDVYAMGLLLYQALTGQLPYDPEVPAGKLIAQIRDRSVMRPSFLEAAINDEMDAIVLQAMSKEPDRRYQSAWELRDDLQAWLDGRAVRARADNRWYVLRKAAMVHRRALGLLLLIVVMLGGIAVVGLVAKSQASRAVLASAVRDARTIESHWWRIAEFRTIGQDNFEAGELGLWDAILAPEPALVAGGIEPPVAEGGLPKGAAYWGLWEMYAGSPIVFSVPTLDRTISTYDPNTDLIVKYAPERRELELWDWRDNSVVRSVGVGSLVNVRSYSISPDSSRMAIVQGDGRMVMVDLRYESVEEFEPLIQANTGILTADRLLISTRLQGDSSEILLWDSSAQPERLLSRIALPDLMKAMTIDSSVKYAAALTYEGDLVVLDMRTGDVLLERPKEAQPRFLVLQTRGNEGEFLLFSGSLGIALDMNDPQRRFVPLLQEGGVLRRRSTHRVFPGQRSHRDRDRSLPPGDRHEVEIRQRRNAHGGERKFGSVVGRWRVYVRTGATIGAIDRPRAGFGCCAPARVPRR